MTKEELQYLTLYELRVIGRELGVKHPTMLNKKELIDAIISCKNNENTPRNIETRGRKARAGKTNIVITSTIDIKTINKIDKILTKAKKDILNLLTN